MNIEIKGVNFINKGAELMLLSILKEFEERKSDAEFCLNLKDIAHAPPDYDQLSFYPWRYSKKVPFLGMILNAFFEKTGIKKYKGRKVIIKKEIDVILDASGFVYSEQWGPESAEVMATYFEQAKKDGKTVILLPQAFGPFKQKKMITAMQCIINHADLIFARDEISYESLIEISEQNKNIFKCPDFTIKMKGDPKKELNHFNNKVCIIPNYRMVDMMEGKEYLNFLDSLISCLKNTELDYYILIHESDKDKLLAEKLQERRNEKIEIVFEENPIKIKEIIGASRFVVASRYHGIVSALTHSIPTIATGWSHKYQMLYKEYDMEQFYIDDLSNSDKLQMLIEELSDSKKYDLVEQKLKINNHRVLEQVNGMWDKVFSLIDAN